MSVLPDRDTRPIVRKRVPVVGFVLRSVPDRQTIAEQLPAQAFGLIAREVSFDMPSISQYSPGVVGEIGPPLAWRRIERKKVRFYATVNFSGKSNRAPIVQVEIEEARQYERAVLGHTPRFGSTNEEVIPF